MAVEHAVHEAQAQVRRLASQATEAELDLPELGGTLRPFQVAGVAYTIEARRTFIADEMGLGKTVQALASLEALHAFPALIVTTPLSSSTGSGKPATGYRIARYSS